MKLELVVLVAIVVAGLTSKNSFASSFNPGPPPRLDNFQVSEDVFSGTVESIAPSSSDDRGDTKAAVKVLQVWKGTLVPGASVSLSFTRYCPILTKHMRCVQHTLQLKPGEVYAFFTRGSPNRFAAKAFGTQEYSKVSFELEGMKAGFDLAWLMAARRKMPFNMKDVFVASVVRGRQGSMKAWVAGSDRPNFESVFLKVEKVLVGNRKVGEVSEFGIMVKNRLGYGWDKGHFEKLKENILVSPVAWNANLFLYPDEGVAPLSLVKREAIEIRNYFEKRIPKIEERKILYRSVGRIDRSWDFAEFFSSFKVLGAHMEFAVGMEWNPDPDAVER